MLHLLTPLILLLSTTFSYEFSLSPGWGLSSIGSSHTFFTMHRRWRAGSASVHVPAGFCPASLSELIHFFLLAAPFCLRVGLDVSLYDYKDRLTAEKQVSCWFSLSAPKWPFIQNINYLAHCFWQIPFLAFLLHSCKYISWYCTCKACSEILPPAIFHLAKSGILTKYVVFEVRCGGQLLWTHHLEEEQSHRNSGVSEWSCYLGSVFENT